jgi:hypothetical protein
MKKTHKKSSGDRALEILLFYMKYAGAYSYLHNIPYIMKTHIKG